MKSIIGILLILLAVGLSYDGFTKFQDSSASVKVLGIELSAENKGAKQTAFVEIGLGVVSLIAGLYLMRGKKA